MKITLVSGESVICIEGSERRTGQLSNNQSIAIFSEDSVVEYLLLVRGLGDSSKFARLGDVPSELINCFLELSHARLDVAKGHMQVNNGSEATVYHLDI